MTRNLAAVAAEVELGDLAHDDYDDVETTLAEADAPNPLAVRDALLKLAALERQRDETQLLAAQIFERYDDAIDRKKGAIAAIRDSLKVYAQRFGKVSFPDVGGIHLTTQHKGGKARVADAVVFEDYVRTTFPAIAETCIETVERFDAAKALALVIDEFDVTPTPGGSIVNIVTGEDQTEAFDLVGVGVVPESKTLAVRKS